METEKTKQEKGATRKNFFSKRVATLKRLNKGIYRSIIAGSFILPLILAIIFFDGMYIEDFFSIFIGAMGVYWILLFVGLWIYEGFKFND